MKRLNIGIISLILMTITAVDNIRNLPSIAIFGKHILFFYIVAAFCFFIPCALVSAQLSSVPGNENGVYHWVKKALGLRFGLTAIWLQWVENLVWYPTLLTFITGTLGYWISRELSQNPKYLILSSIFCFFLMTILNLYGLKLSTKFSNLSSILGLILPMFFIILLGIEWYISGNLIPKTLTEMSFVPDLFDVNTWTAITSVVMSLCGIEITTAHVNRTNHPQKNFPKALLISTVVILSSLILASFSIAIVVPTDELSFVSGIVQALEVFLNKSSHLNLLKYFVFGAILGSLGSLNNWLLAPIQGLKEAAKDGLLPVAFNAVNKNNIPTTLLFAQAIIVTLLIYSFYYFPSINSAYWFMTVIASQLYMLMYMLMFISYLLLRNNQHYTFKIPGGKISQIIIASLGIFGCLATFLIGFIPFKCEWKFLQYGLLVLFIVIFIVFIPQCFSFKSLYQNLRRNKMRIPIYSFKT